MGFVDIPANPTTPGRVSAYLDLDISELRTTVDLLKALLQEYTHRRDFSVCNGVTKGSEPISSPDTERSGHGPTANGHRAPERWGSFCSDGSASSEQISSRDPEVQGPAFRPSRPSSGLCAQMPVSAVATAVPDPAPLLSGVNLHDRGVPATAAAAAAAVPQQTLQATTTVAQTAAGTHVQASTKPPVPAPSRASSKQSAQHGWVPDQPASRR